MADLSLIKLSPRARLVLEDLASQSASGRTVRRAQALLWLDGGETVTQVAHRLKVSRQMIYLAVARYQARQELPVRQRVQDTPHPGRPATKRQLVAAAVQVLLQQAPGQYGYRAQSWTTPMLKVQLQQQQLSVSEDTVQRALHALRYRYKRPRYVLARRAPHWRQAKGGCKAAC